MIRNDHLIPQPTNARLVYRYAVPQTAVKNTSFLAKLVHGIRGIPKWMWQNKFKTIFILVLIYATRKLYCFYRDWIKPFYDIKKSFFGTKTAEN